MEYTKGQDPTVIMSGHYTWDSNLPSSINISPDEKLVALSQDKSLEFYSVLWLLGGVAGFSLGRSVMMDDGDKVSELSKEATFWQA